jgi:murein DD-endopeptidase MepM/ murein hydrolase activator NlpD
MHIFEYHKMKLWVVMGTVGVIAGATGWQLLPQRVNAEAVSTPISEPVVNDPGAQEGTCLDETPAPADIATPIDTSTWTTYTDPKTGAMIKYPSNWYIKVNTDVGPVRGFDSIMLTSYDTSKLLSEVCPAGDQVREQSLISIDFYDNNKTDKESIMDYMKRKISPNFQSKRRVVFYGTKEIAVDQVEWGTTYLLSNGPNVFSVFDPVDNSITNFAVLQQIVAQLEIPSTVITYEPWQKDPSGFLESAMPKVQYFDSIDSSDLLEAATPFPEEVEKSQPQTAAQATSLPAMELPWQAGNKNYSGGPHTRKSVTHNCSWGTGYPKQEMSGLDFSLANGTEVLAVADGSVTTVGTDPSFGKIIKINHTGGLQTWYAHLSRQDVVAGQYVQQGTVIGLSGNTGQGTDNYHLHLELANTDGSAYPADGVVIDNYKFRSIWRAYDGYGWNYQGTAIKGSEATLTLTYCMDSDKYIKGSTVTVEAGGCTQGVPNCTASMTSTNQRIVFSNCSAPPPDTTWYISQSCTISGTVAAPRNVEVNNNAQLTIGPSGFLNMNLSGYVLWVRNGASIIVSNGGKIN